MASTVQSLDVQDLQATGLQPVGAPRSDVPIPDVPLCANLNEPLVSPAEIPARRAVTPSEPLPVLADAAGVLSDQLLVHLQRLAEFLQPHIDTLTQRFIGRLKKLGYNQRQWHALSSISLGAAAGILTNKQPLSAFFEQIEYHGRRLAKLNVPPSDIVSALQQYDLLLTPLLDTLAADEYANVQWVREQLNFCVILTLNNSYYQVREGETQAFYELFRVELESRNLDELLHRFLQTLVHVTQAGAGNVFLWDQAMSCWTHRAALPGPDRQPAIHAKAAQRRLLARPRYFTINAENARFLLDPGWNGRYVSCWSIPLETGGHHAGLLQFAFTREYEWLPREMELLTAASERFIMAAEKARLMEDLAKREEQVRQLAEHMLHVEEIERRRISCELHDEAGQSLLYIRLQMEMIEQSLPESMADVRRKLSEARDVTEHTILEIRRLIAALSPAVLEQLGLGAALRQLLNRFRRLHPCKVRLHLPKQLILPKKTEVIVYRLVQECCNNIKKHSEATRVNISVTSADGTLKLLVEDNGIGFHIEEALAKRDSFGLSGMRERVALMGGRFEMVSRPAAGAGHAKSTAHKDEGEDVSRCGNSSSNGHHVPSRPGHVGSGRSPARMNKGKRGTEIYIELPIPAEMTLV